MDTNVIAFVILGVAALIFAVAVVAILGALLFLMKRRGQAAVPMEEAMPRTGFRPPVPGPAPVPSAPQQADPGASPFDSVRNDALDEDESADPEGGATEVFMKDSHGRLMGWDDEDDDDEDNSGATELFSRDALKSELAGLLHEEDDGEDYSLDDDDDDDDDGLPGKVVAE